MSTVSSAQMIDLLSVFLCPILILMVSGFFCLSIYLAMKDAITRVRRLHQIPCSRCAFFTGDYRLKCTVHPCKALSEEAIDCLDYEPTSVLARPTCLQSQPRATKQVVGFLSQFSTLKNQ
jgi:hypothetical protein